jgi:hypothetical protein
MRVALRVFGLLLFACFCVGSHASAREKVEIKIGKLGSSPPFTISAWRYQLLNRRIHMHFCASAACEPGSKVSYTVSSPRKRLSFTQYKDTQFKLMQTLKKMAPPGMRINLAEPEQHKNKLSLIFKAKRVHILPNGKRTAFLSWLVMADRVTFDFISSASTLKKAEEQLAPFVIAGMMVAVGDK